MTINKHQIPPRYCSACGERLREQQTRSESRSQWICASCGVVAYKNPVVLVTTIVELEGRVLMCRRAQAPRVGYWTLPGGYVEHDESLEHAAVRETMEETGVEIDIGALRIYALSSLTNMSQIYIGFVTRLDRRIAPVCGDECLEVRYFSEQEMPWSDLAFPGIDRYLRIFFSESRRREAHVHFFAHLGGEAEYDDDATISGATRTLLDSSNRWSGPME